MPSPLWLKTQNSLVEDGTLENIVSMHTVSFENVSTLLGDVENDSSSVQAAIVSAIVNNRYVFNVFFIPYAFRSVLLSTVCPHVMDGLSFYK